MPGPNIANVSYADTFDQWRVKTNQVIDLVDGKLVYFTSNSAPLTLTADTYAQGNVFFKLAISNSRNDTSTANLATANAIYTVATHGDAAFQMGNGAFTKANAANVYANSIAMAANAYSVNVGASGNAYSVNVGASGNAYAVFVGNSANIYANAVGAAANAKSANVGFSANAFSVNVGFSANAYSVNVGASGNAYANYVGVSGNSYADYVGDAANAYSSNIGFSANAYVVYSTGSSNNYTNTSTAAANAYADYVGNAANVRANAVGTAGNTYAGVMANSSNSYAGYMANSANLYGGYMANSANIRANVVGTAGNTYAGVMANSSNAYADSVGAAANNFANGKFTTIANGTAAFDVANLAYGNAVTALIMANAAYIGVFDAANASVTFFDEVSSSNTYYLSISPITGGTTRNLYVSSTKLTYTPNTGLLYTPVLRVGSMNVVPSITDAWNKANNANLYAMTFANSKFLANTSGAIFAGDLGITGNLSGQRIIASSGIFVSGQALLGNTSSPGIISFEYPTTRFYVGDNTGYSFSFAKKNANVVTDIMTIKDQTNRVGINNFTPNYTLDVIGNANISSPTLLVGGQNVLAAFTSSNAYTDYATVSANSYAGAMANAANDYADYVATSANAKSANIAFSSNAYTNYATVSANLYAGAMANSANAKAANVAISANAYADYVGAAANAKSANVGFSGNVYTNYVGDAANAKSANIAFSVNTYAAYIGTSANARTANAAFSINIYATAVATQQAGISNTYAADLVDTYTTAGNNYSKGLATSGNLYALATATTIGTSGNNYTIGLTNARLANTNGITFDGSLYIRDNFGVGMPAGNTFLGDFHVNGTSYIVGSTTIVSSTLTVGGVNIISALTAGNNRMTGYVSTAIINTETYTESVGAASNNYMTGYVTPRFTAGNNYMTGYVTSAITTTELNTDAVGTAGNNYMTGYVTPRFTAGNNYTVGLVNTKLANTSGITFNGALDFTSDVTATEFNVRADTTNRLNQGFMVLRSTSPRIILRNSTAYTNGALIQCSGNSLYFMTMVSDTETGGTINGGYGAQYPARFILNTGDAYVAADFFAYGNITAFASDERLKENIQPIPNALEKVKQIDGITFDWKDLAEQVGFKPRARFNQVGVLAQQIEKVLPQAVAIAPFDADVDDSGATVGSKSGENYLTVQYERVVPLLIEAIKEQQRQIDELKSQINNK